MISLTISQGNLALANVAQPVLVVGEGKEGERERDVAV
jgi:hypothetical protein